MKAPPGSVPYYDPKGKRFEGYVCPNGLGERHLQFDTPAYVLVSGSDFNPFGHALLLLDSKIGFVHAAVPGVHPALYIPWETFPVYVQQWRKHVLKTHYVCFPNLLGASAKTNEFLTQGFEWTPLHDCLTMVDEIAFAGGCKYQAKRLFPTWAAAELNWKQQREVYDGDEVATNLRANRQKSMNSRTGRA